MTQPITCHPNLLVLRSSDWLEEISLEPERLHIDDPAGEARTMLQHVVGRAGYYRQFIVDAEVPPTGEGR